MDFQGQKLAEQLLVRLLIAFAAVGFLAGYAMGDFALMSYINAAGLLLTTVLVVPDWPMFNKQPLNWLPPLNPGQQVMGAVTSSKGSSNKSRKA